MPTTYYGTSFVYGSSFYSTPPDPYTGLYPRPADLKIFVAGKDITLYVLATSIQITSVLTRQIDSCTFKVINAGGLDWRMKEWDEVMVYDGVVKIFGGFLMTIDNDNAGGGTRLDLTLHAGDYACYLDHIYVTKQWTTGMTDYAIIQYLFLTYWNYLDVSTFVETIKTYPKIRFNRVTLRQIIDQLADAAAADWYIDYNRFLHFFSISTEVAPFGLSYDPDLNTTFPFNNLIKNMDGSGVINRIEIVGGNYLSDNTTIYIAGTGQDVRALIPFFIHAESGQTAIRIWRNDGTLGAPTWTPMTVKIGNIDTIAATTDVLLYFSDKVIQQSAAWPNLANAIKISCRYEIPLRSRFVDNASFAFYGDKYMDYVINDPSITDRETARMIGTGKLIQASTGSVALRCEVYEPGLYAGQLVPITAPLLEISDAFILVRNQAKFTTGGYATYMLDLGIHRPDLIDFIVKLARKANTAPPWRDDEVLDEVVPTDETLNLVTEVTAAPTSHVTGNYKWGVDADNAKWDFATYG